jgi:dTDP-4-dehydrorhamnose 3,5-epimerase
MAGPACSPLDPALGIEWPLAVDAGDPAQVSRKDRDAPLVADLPETAS